MTIARSKNRAQTSGGTAGSENTAKIISHPNRMSGLIAKKETLHELLTEQKKTAIRKIEKTIADVEETRAENNATPANRIVRELLLVLEELRIFNPLKAPDAEHFVQIANRLEEASVAFMYESSAASLKRICWNPKVAPEK